MAKERKETTRNVRVKVGMKLEIGMVKEVSQNYSILGHHVIKA